MPTLSCLWKAFGSTSKHLSNMVKNVCKILLQTLQCKYNLKKLHKTRNNFASCDRVAFAEASGSHARLHETREGLPLASATPKAGGCFPTIWAHGQGRAAAWDPTVPDPQPPSIQAHPPRTSSARSNVHTNRTAGPTSTNAITDIATPQISYPHLQWLSSPAPALERRVHACHPAESRVPTATTSRAKLHAASF